MLSQKTVSHNNKIPSSAKTQCEFSNAYTKIATADLKFLLTTAQKWKKCTTFDNFRTIT